MRTYQIYVKGNRVQYAENLNFGAVYYKDTNVTDVTIPARDIQQAYNIAKVYFHVANKFYREVRRNKELLHKK